MIKFLFILLAWWGFGWFFVEKCLPKGYYDIFDEWAKDNNYTEKDGDWLKHLEVQAIAYLVAPCILVAIIIYEAIRQICKSHYDKR